MAELVGDYVMECSGVSAERTVTVDLLFNVELSPVSHGGLPDPLLIVGDPAPGSQVFGANVWRATAVSAAAISFHGVKLPALQTGGKLRIRITNIRVNALRLGLSPGRLDSYVSITPGDIAIADPYQGLAWTALGPASSTRSVDGSFSIGRVLDSCVGLNGHLRGAPGAQGGTGVFLIRFRENEAFQMRPRYEFDAAGLPIPRNVPGQGPWVESGFFDPNLPPTDGLNQVGVASQGTRLVARITGIPPGVSAFVTVKPVPFGTSAATPQDAIRLITTDPGGAGGGSTVVPTTSADFGGNLVDIAPVNTASGTALTVWEVLKPLSAAERNDLAFGVLLAYNPTYSSAELQVRAGLGPFYDESPADGSIAPYFTAFQFNGLSSYWDEYHRLPSIWLRPCGTQLADLNVAAAQIPPSSTAGSDISVEATVANSGVAAGPFRVTISRFADPEFTQPQPGSVKCDVGGLAPGASTTCRGTLELEEYASSTSYVAVVADALGRIPEWNKANNTHTVQVQVSPCMVSLVNRNLLVGSNGTPNGSVLVSTGPRCSWRAVSDVPWITLAASTGVGPLAVSFTVPPNPGTNRTGHVTIGNQQFTVVQAGIECTYTAGSTSLTIPADGGETTAGVTTQAGCPWRVTSSAGWLSVASDVHTGPGSFAITSARNTSAARSGTLEAAGLTFTVEQAQAVVAQGKIAAFNGGIWVVDLDGSFAWGGSTTDRVAFFSLGTGEVPVVGDWNGSGTLKMGVYRTGTWLLDYNGNGVWDGPSTDKIVFFGGAGYTPIVGDWNGSGNTKIGAHKDGYIVLDFNGNFAWDGTSTDKLIFFGGPGYSIVVGDWNGSGTSKIAAYKDGYWIMDHNGNFAWDGTATDKLIFFGGPGYAPVVGDWNATGHTSIAAHKDGYWVIDHNGNFQWDGTSVDKYVFFGGPGYVPVTGDWDESGTQKIGAYGQGTWILDINGSYTWDPPTDKVVFFGGAGYTPVPGSW